MSVTTITTTGDLRTFLVEVMLDVRSGKTDPDNARSIVKLAGQVNESIYAELKNKKMLMDAKEPSPDFGRLKVGG